jgi:hypothetical protein
MENNLPSITKRPLADRRYTVKSPKMLAERGGRLVRAERTGIICASRAEIAHSEPTQVVSERSSLRELRHVPTARTRDEAKRSVRDLSVREPDVCGRARRSGSIDSRRQQSIDQPGRDTEPAHQKSRAERKEHLTPALHRRPVLLTHGMRNPGTMNIENPVALPIGGTPIFLTEAALQTPPASAAR